MTSGSASRPGFVLVWSLLLVFVAAAVSAGVVVTATRESAIAHRHLLLLRARSAAEAAAAEIAAGWSTRRYRDVGVGEDRTVSTTPLQTIGTVTRLDSTTFVIAAEAGVPDRDLPPAIARAALIVATLDGRSLEPFFPPAVVADSLLRITDGAITDVSGCPGGEPHGAWAPSLMVEDGLAPVPLSAASPAHVPDSVVAILEGLATLRVGTRAAPRPARAGDACAPGPDNWGSIQPSDVCHDLLPLIHAPGDLELEGGEGRGILVVGGNLTVSGSFAFEGIVLVRGRMMTLRNATVRGAIRANEVELAGGRVITDGCAVRDVLDSGAFDRVFRPGERLWIPQFEPQ